MKYLCCGGVVKGVDEVKVTIQNKILKNCKTYFTTATERKKFPKKK